jgi:histidinol dehydrogenase
MVRIRVYDYPKDKRALERAFAGRQASNPQIDRTVAEIIEAVRQRGDAALLEYTEKLDGRRLTPRTMRVDPRFCEAAWRNLDPERRRAFEYARDGIERFHRRQLRKGFVLNSGGARLEQRIRPLKRVGVYVPGGRAAYPSTVLMNVIPAQVAGVKEIIVATPPVHGSPEDFAPFAAAHMLGVSHSVYLMGGAQAVAAMAYGTKSVPRVDKVVGPGNAYVAAAKRMLYGVIDIDSVAGESEVLIIADSTARADYIAADLLAQAEHTGGETVVLVGIGRSFNFAAVERELRDQLENAPRRAQALQSLRQGGFFVRVPDAAAAVEVAEMKAPEHMEIMTRDPEKIAEQVSNVGAVFVGCFTPEPIGDYVAGPNHVLPTGGTARFFSPLGVDDFLKSSNVLQFSEAAFNRAAPHTIALAESEGLFAHAEAIRVRQRRQG